MREAPIQGCSDCSLGALGLLESCCDNNGKDGIDPEATGVPAESLLEAAAECTDPKWWHNTTKHITGNKRAGRAAKRTGATDAAAESRLRAAAAQKRNPGLR